MNALRTTLQRCALILLTATIISGCHIAHHMHKRHVELHRHGKKVLRSHLHHPACGHVLFDGVWIQIKNNAKKHRH